MGGCRNVLRISSPYPAWAPIPPGRCGPSPTSFRRRWSTPISVGSWLAGTASGSHRTECNNALMRSHRTISRGSGTSRSWSWAPWCARSVRRRVGRVPCTPGAGGGARATTRPWVPLRYRHRKPDSRGVIVNFAADSSMRCEPVLWRDPPSPAALQSPTRSAHRTDCRRARARRAGRRGGRDAPAAVSVRPAGR